MDEILEVLAAPRDGLIVPRDLREFAIDASRLDRGVRKQQVTRIRHGYQVLDARTFFALLDRNGIPRR